MFKNLQLVHDLHTPVTDRVILPFGEGYSLEKFVQFRENKTLTKISKFTAII